MSGWDIKGKTVLITGATDGIGYATALELAKRGAHVVLTTRSVERGETVRQKIIEESGNSHVDVFFCDLASLVSVKACAESFIKTYTSLHVLINNAGVMPLAREISQDGVELNLAVNYLAPVLLTELLLPLLKKSAPSRIVNVVSQLYAQADIDLANLELAHDFNRYRAYGNSKLALLLYTRSLAKSLVGSSVTTNALHPGVIRTKLSLGSLGNSNPVVKFAFPLLTMRSLEHGAKTSVFLATDPGVGDINGEYFVDSQARETTAMGNDLRLAEELLAAAQERYMKNYL